MKRNNVILMSVKEKWLSLIKDGTKTLEVRKNFPCIGEIEKIRKEFYATHKANDYSEDYLKMVKKINKYPSIFDVYFYESGNSGRKKVVYKTEVNGFSRITLEYLEAGKKLEEIMLKHKDLWFEAEENEDISKKMKDQEEYFIMWIGSKRIAFSKTLIEMLPYDFRTAVFGLEFRVCSSVPFDELINYMKGSDCLYGWHINEIEEVNLELKDFTNLKGLVLKRPPQSYVYVRLKNEK